MLFVNIIFLRFVSLFSYLFIFNLKTSLLNGVLFLILALFVDFLLPILHSSTAQGALSHETSLGSEDEVPSYCQYTLTKKEAASVLPPKDCFILIIFNFQLLLCQLLIFLKKLIDFLNVIIRLHGQCRFVNWSDNLLFFFQVICYFRHALVLLQLFYNQ